MGAKRKVHLNPEFLSFLLRTNPDIELTEAEWVKMFGREEFPLLRADELELHQRIFQHLESDQVMRFEIYGYVATLIVLIKTFFAGGLKRQLGMQKRSLFNVFTALAQNLEWFGAALRGDLKVPPGRVNVELASLVDAIVKHQKQPLTQVELYEAVKGCRSGAPRRSRSVSTLAPSRQKRRTSQRLPV